MKRYLFAAFFVTSLTGTPVMAGDQSLDAAVGGAVGGGLGAFIGNEIGGRNGAVLGGALGAAAGAVVATDHERHHPQRPNYSYHNHLRPYYYVPPRAVGRFCPPGQAKKGRC